MKCIPLALLALVLGAATSFQAQNPTQPKPMAPLPTANGEVLGSVVDTATKEPVARASVAVRSRKDSSLVTGAITGPDGAFRIQGLRPGDYYLRTTSIGFKPRTYTFSITDAAPRANVGPLTLTRVAVTLQPVQVAGQVPTMVIEPDRNSYRAKDVAPAAANASEVLQATPSVEVDGDGKVSLRGNENVAIQINGRPTPITGPQLAAYLKQIPANIVERIEVVPNPSAKYDPEGMAGIINIVLKAQTDLGISGGLNVGGATLDRMNAGTNLGYQSGPITLFGTYGYNADNRDVSGLNDRGFNHLSYVGLLRAQRELGLQQRVYQAKSTQEYIPNLSTFARQGYDLTIGVGFTEADAIDTVATNFPNSKFAIVDVDQTQEKHKPANLLGLLFTEQETGYLVGYLAGLEEKRLPGKDVIASVGGQKQPPVDRFIAGYQAGARAADPGVTTLNAYSDDFNDQAKCKQIALNQIDQGASVVFQVAGGCGLGALDAAKEKGVWGIGVDADQSFLGPHILTSAVKRVDTAVFDAIKLVADGKFKGGNIVFGLKDNGVGIGKISPKVPKSEVKKVMQIRADIIAGKIKNIPTEVK